MHSNVSTAELRAELNKRGYMPGLQFAQARVLDVYDRIFQTFEYIVVSDPTLSFERALEGLRAVRYLIVLSPRTISDLQQFYGLLRSMADLKTQVPSSKDGLPSISSPQNPLL